MNHFRTMLCALTLAAALLCSGCDNRTEPTSPAQEPTAQEQTTPEQTTPETPETEPTTEPGVAPTPETEPTVDPLACYAPVFDELCDAVYNGLRDEDEYPLLPTGVEEMLHWSDGEETAAMVGWMLTDLNGDGTQELLVVQDEDIVVGGYSIVNGAPVRFLNGWSRNMYFLLADGCFYNQGSGGAMYTMFGRYHLSEDGTQLVCEDCYFTDVKEGSEDELAFFHNTTGEWDTAASEPFEGTLDDFWASSEALADGHLVPELTPLSAYEYTGPLNQPLDCLVRADYWDEISWRLPESEAIADYFPEQTPTGADGELIVVFRAKREVQDLRLLSLSLQDVDAAGNPVFDVTELWCLPRLKAGAPLTVPMSFPGDMPTSGFSYVSDGVQRQFTLSQSGRDGALVVSEFGMN
ncbi:MAG: hypothetical protein K6G54_07425 [Oscillospiraceae bacterium]|nr:hypothetical protein [Oscillospiraceae bacterium]